MCSKLAPSESSRSTHGLYIVIMLDFFFYGHKESLHKTSRHQKWIILWVIINLACSSWCPDNSFTDVSMWEFRGFMVARYLSQIHIIFTMFSIFCLVWGFTWGRWSLISCLGPGFKFLLYVHIKCIKVIILWGSWMSVLNVIAIHPLLVDIFQWATWHINISAIDPCC